MTLRFSALISLLSLSLPAAEPPPNLARQAQVQTSSATQRAPLAIDGDASDQSRWISKATPGKAHTLTLTFPEKTTLGGVHLYTGYRNEDPPAALHFEFLSEGKWVTIPSAEVRNNTSTALRLPF
ncbi:MAG: hypothetical protein ACQKBY_09730, partial [Verrucomicrobiales bacterium]